MMSYRDTSLTISERVANLIGVMTLPEKIAQLGSCWSFDLRTLGKLDMQKVKKILKPGIGQITRVAGASTLDPVSAAKEANLMQDFLMKNTRLGIPAIIHEECCSGNMILGGSTFPQIIGLASTFQPELAEKMTIEIRRQLLAIGARQGLAPVLDVARDPRWGRVEETFGEDPILISQFGMRYIIGLQGKDLRDGVIATGKHFVGYSLSEGGLNCAPVQIGPRALWDIYLMPFQAAIRDANIASIMNAYPELDEVVVAASREILTDLLRNKLGFSGVLSSDYETVLMLHNFHYIAPDKKTAATMALNAGIDVELPTTQCYQELTDEIKAGKISMDLIDTALSRHLQKKFELGLFENPYVDEGQVMECFETPDQRALALDIAQQSMVLLTNNGILPLEKNIQTMAVIGPNANSERNLLGDYSYAAGLELLMFSRAKVMEHLQKDPSSIEPYKVKVPTILEAICAKMSQGSVLFSKGCDIFNGNQSDLSEAVRFAKKSDVVILVLGDKAGLTPDCTCGETRDSADLKLPLAQMELAEAIFNTGKPVIVILINGRPLAIPEITECASAVLEGWLPGEEGGVAIANIIFGDTNPGGKLPITFPRSVGQVPIFYNHKPTGSHSQFYTDYVSESVKPLFPFGHGLSYSTFKYSDLHLTPQKASEGESIEISLKLENTSNTAGEEVVQLYINDEYSSISRPVKELKGFVRVCVAPGKKRTIIFKFPVDMLAYYDENLELVVEPGKVKIFIGSSSDDIRLSGEIEISGNKKWVVTKRVFVCPVDVH